MTHLVSFFLVLAMVGLLCSAIWGPDVAKKLDESQQIRVRTAGTLIFH